MQDKYVSLDPSFAAGPQYHTDRTILYRQRYEQARGGNNSRQVGLLFGLTTATYFYVRAQKSGFPGFFPLQRIHAGNYAIILGSGFLAYNFFNGLVSSITGDMAQHGHLIRNKY